MSEVDLEKFLKKVDSLVNLVASLDEKPERRGKLSLCSTHDEVVALAKSWGYEIGTRWGE